MEQLTLEQAAQAYYAQPSVHSLQTIEAFKAGADWQKEQYKETISLLKGIAEWAGNLPDNKLTTQTGANDAAHRGGLITDMRSIAVEAIRRIEPDYVPFLGYIHSS